MIQNPIIEKSVTTQPSKYSVVLVVKNEDDIAISYNIRRFCKEQNIIFICRAYDSRKIYEDRNFIESLPAIHMYEQTHYLKTIHMNMDPVVSIRFELNRPPKKSKNIWNILKTVLRLPKRI